MFSIKKTILVDASPERCAEALSDPIRLQRIDRKVDRMQAIAGSNPEQIELHGRLAAMPFRLRLTVDRKADGGFVVRGRAGLLREFEARFDLEATDGGTRITHTESYQFAFASVLERWIRPKFTTIVDEELDRLRVFIRDGWNVELPWNPPR